MHNDLWKIVERYVMEHKKRRRTYLVLSVLSVLMAFSVYGALCLPAISMTKDEPRLTAEFVRAVYGDELSFQVDAEAAKGDKPSVFVLHTESNGAGVLDLYDFQEMDEDEVCLIETDEGGSLELHREFKGEGIVNYWFSLDPELSLIHI